MDYLRRCTHKCKTPWKCTRPDCAVIEDRLHIDCHIRRNDLKKINMDICQYNMEELDQQLHDKIEDYLTQPKNVVHVITDCAATCQRLWEKYGRKICYGACWNKLKDTNDEWLLLQSALAGFSNLLPASCSVCLAICQCASQHVARLSCLKCAF